MNDISDFIPYIKASEDWNELMLYVESLQHLDADTFRLPSPASFEECKTYLIEILLDYE